MAYDKEAAKRIITVAVHGWSQTARQQAKREAFQELAKAIVEAATEAGLKTTTAEANTYVFERLAAGGYGARHATLTLDGDEVNIMDTNGEYRPVALKFDSSSCSWQGTKETADAAEVVATAIVALLSK